MKFKPMLAGTVTSLDDLKDKGPWLVSPKLDGVRAVVIDGVLVSRNLKPIRNEYTQSLFGRPELEGLDGELIVGHRTDGDVFNRTQSGVMSKDGVPDVTFHVFDLVGTNGFGKRLSDAARIAWEQQLPIVPVRHHRCAGLHSVVRLEALYTAEGYEGIMLRAMSGPYKFGRSTLNEGYLLKYKRWFDAEAVVTGCVELMHNDNEQTTDELGRSKRSKKKAGLVGTGELGALKCSIPSKDGTTTVAFELGTGFTAAQRAEYWRSKSSLTGQVVTFKYQEFTKDGVPRFPVFKGFRDPADLSNE